MTAMPWGQKKRTREMIQSQTVTPPLAAIEGTTFRLKTATTKSRTRSRRPRTRLSWGAGWAVVDKFLEYLSGRSRFLTVRGSQRKSAAPPESQSLTSFARPDSRGRLYRHEQCPSHMAHCCLRVIVEHARRTRVSAPH